jgi:hypothetical protein
VASAGGGAGKGEGAAVTNHRSPPPPTPPPLVLGPAPPPRAASVEATHGCSSSSEAVGRWAGSTWCTVKGAARSIGQGAAGRVWGNPWAPQPLLKRRRSPRQRRAPGFARPREASSPAPPQPYAAPPNTTLSDAAPPRPARLQALVQEVQGGGADACGARRALGAARDREHGRPAVVQVWPGVLPRQHLEYSAPERPHVRAAAWARRFVGRAREQGHGALGAGRGRSCGACGPAGRQAGASGGGARPALAPHRSRRL